MSKKKKESLIVWNSNPKNSLPVRIHYCRKDSLGFPVISIAFIGPGEGIDLSILGFKKRKPRVTK